LDALTDKGYYFTVERKNYKFSLKENLNKRFSDKTANVPSAQIEEAVKQEIQKQFAPKEGLERVFFPEKSIEISDRPVVTFVVCDPNRGMGEEKETLASVEQMTKECGTSARTFKSAVIWIVAESPHLMQEQARKFLAWQAVADESEDLKLDETQKQQLAENVQKARRDLKESVWRSYKHVLLLAKDNSFRQVDLGLVHSSSADSPISNILNRLTADGDFDKGISVRLLLKNWSPAFTEWPTKAVRDAIYASPQFPRILKGTEAIKDAIAKGVSAGEIAYVSKASDGRYSPFVYQTGMVASDVEISDDVFIIRKETADAYKTSAVSSVQETPGSGQTEELGVEPKEGPEFPAGDENQPTPSVQAELLPRIQWIGEVPPQKWMNFYTKVVSKFVASKGVKLTVTFEAAPEDGVSKQKIEEIKAALRELGLDPEIKS
jgi:hypothetical protein